LSALKKRRVIVTGAVVSCLVVLGLSAPSASAYDSGAKGPSTATTGPVPSPVRVDLPPTSASPIRLTSGDNQSVTIQLPSSSNVARLATASAGPAAARAIGPNATRYDNILPDTDSTVEDVNGSVRISMITKTATAPRKFSFPLTLPAGSELRLQDDGSVIAVAQTVSGMKYIAGVKAPYAYDATGKAVATRFQVSGTTLTQTISPPADATYPIVSDPWLGKDLIDHATWVHHAEGWTLQVTPTGWQRFWNGYWPASAGWDELYSKYRNLGLNTNLQGMRDQYICHVQIVSVRAPNRPTWNLDEWRPNVGYVQTINSSCNPGGAKWFD
jgi:Protein of unknown function (DUF2599)